MFKDSEHKEFYNQKIMEYVNTGKKVDSHIKPLFYLLAMTEDTRNNFARLFDMENEQINSKSLSDEWLTSSTQKVCRLAFNLFANYKQDGRKKVSEELTPDNLFATDFSPFFVQAIMLRYQSYFRTKLD